MAIKPQYILRSFLLLPFFGWGLALAFSLLFSAAGDALAANPVLDFLGTGLAVFTFGIIGWGVPYVILAVGIFWWSLKKTAGAIYKALIVSPLLLSALIFIELAVITYWPQGGLPPADGQEPLSLLAVALVPTLAVGYLFVGLGALIYWGLKRAKLVAAEEGETLVTAP